MCFLGEPFQHDLFVSYSHGDLDGSGQSNLKTWSQAFARELEGELRQHPRFRELKIFLDQHHRPSQSVDPLAALTKQVEDHIGAAGLLVILMSPQYLLSKWCGDERDWWFACQQSHGLAIDGRVVVARIWPTNDPWPPCLADEHGHPLIGFPFYDSKRADLRPQPHEWPDPTGAKGPFRDALLDMVGRIWQRLGVVKEQLEERARRNAEAGHLAADAGQVIYLHARKTHAEAWSRAREALMRREFIIAPTEPDPVERDPKLALEIAERRVETLTGCDGLLLLGAEDARALEADLIVVGRHDRHSARDRSRRLLPCAVLNTGGLANATPDRKDMAQRLGIHWIDATSDVWPTEVRSWLIETSAVVERV